MSTRTFICFSHRHSEWADNILMASAASRLLKAAWVQGLQKRVQTLFSRKYLLLTNTTITIGLSCTGDLLQQNYEMFRKRQSAWNPTRSRNVCISGSVIGPTCHFWYQLLDRVLPGKTIKIVCKKVFLDQIIFSPINISMFLIVMGIVESASIKSIWKDLREKGLQLLKAEWIVWPPAQLVNFTFISPRYRVLYDNTVSLGFDYYYSYVKFHDASQEEEREEEEVSRMQEPNTLKLLLGSSHHLGATCYQLKEQREVEKQFRQSSKCHSEFDL